MKTALQCLVTMAVGHQRDSRYVQTTASPLVTAPEARKQPKQGGILSLQNRQQAMVNAYFKSELVDRLEKEIDRLAIAQAQPGMLFVQPFVK